MKRATFRSFVLIAAVISLRFPLTTYAMDVPSVDIVNAAEQGLKSYLANIALQDLPNFGFKGKAQAEAAVLGHGFHVYTVPPSAFLDDSANDMSALAVPTTMWEFLILSKGKGAVLLKVDKIEGKWVAVSIGSSGIAGDLSTLMETWPVADGYEHRFITVFQASSDFVEISRGGKPAGIVPLISASVAMGLSSEFAPKELLAPDTGVKMIQQAVRTNIREGAVKARSGKLSPAGVSSSVNAAGTVTLNVPVEAQEQSNWCWDASSQCVLKYYGISAKQCDMANFARINSNWGNDDCCANPSGKICNQPNYLITGYGCVLDVLKNWGLDSCVLESCISMQEVVAQIDAYFPFIMAWDWASGGGHALVGYGYDGSNLHYMDPIPGHGYTISDYNWVKGSSDHTWSETLVTNPSNATSNNLSQYTPSGWSAPIVVTRTKGSRKDSSNLNSLDSLYVDWAIINAGKSPDPAGKFITEFSVDGNAVDAWTSDPLQPSSHKELTDYPLGRLTAGTHVLAITTGVPNWICLPKAGNKVYSKTITVAQSPNDKPNLTFCQPTGWPAKLFVSTSPEKGTNPPLYTTDSLYLSFCMTNNGTMPAKTDPNYGYDIAEYYVDGIKGPYGFTEWDPFAVNATWPTYFKMGNLPAGTHSVKVVLDPYNFLDELSKSDNTLSINIKVVTPASTTAVTSDPNPSNYWMPVTFTATVAGLSGGPTPTGTVQFTVDGTNFGSPVTVSGGHAVSPSTSSLSVGSHAVTATYSGDTTYLQSSGKLAGGQTVLKAMSTTIVSSSKDPVNLGQPVTFTATVSGVTGKPTPTGTVQFLVDGAHLGAPVTLSGGSATSPATAFTLQTGNHPVKALYSGDTVYGASNGELSGGQTVTFPATTAIKSSANPSTYGQSVTFTAIVSGPAGAAAVPTGTVQFTVDGTSFGSAVTISGGHAVSPSTSSLSVGSHAVTAAYSGGAGYGASSGTLAGGQTVNKASSTTDLISSLNPANSGQPVTFTARVYGAGAVAPTGTVQFAVDGTNFGSPVTVSGGYAVSSATSSLSVGNHAVTAAYSGDSSYSPSSGTLAGGQTVKLAFSSTTNVTSSSNPSTYGQSVSFTARVAAASGRPTPTGTVQFKVDGTNLGSAITLSGGSASSPATSSLSGGSHSVTAYYSGDGNYGASTGTLNGGLTVHQASCAVNVTSSSNPCTYGQPVTFTANLAGVSGGAAPTGTVQFTWARYTNIGDPVTLSGGSATSQAITFNFRGNTMVTVFYNGDENYQATSGGLIGGQTIE
jgi:hypothetical protein